MAMELYFYNECGFSQSVLNCMTNLHCEDKIIRKNIRENPDNEKELILSNIKFTSYLMNGAVIDGNGSFDWSSGRVGRTFKNSAFKNTDMLFWESDEKDSSNFNDGASRPSEGLTQRHVFGAMFGFFDGHAEFVKWKRWTQLIAHPYKNSLWCYPNSVNGR